MMLFLPALKDFFEAARRYHLWIALGNLEIKQRYKRSVLGPFWITINMGALIFGIGYIYANVFDSVHSSYIPYLAAGIITWNLVNGGLNEGSNSFIAAGPIIKNVTVSKHVHILHSIWRNVIIFFHNILIMFPVYLIYGAFPGWGFLWALLGTAALIVFLVPSALFLAVVSSRYRDIPPALGGILQIAFFATPIIWESEALTNQRWIIDFNPFFHFIECVRAPLLHGTLPLLSLGVTLVLAAAMAVLAMAAYSTARRKIVFWL